MYLINPEIKYQTFAFWNATVFIGYLSQRKNYSQENCVSYIHLVKQQYRETFYCSEN